MLELTPSFNVDNQKSGSQRMPAFHESHFLKRLLSTF